MLVAARDAGIKRFVFAASSSTYGDSESLPKVEEVIGRPLSPYAVTKYVDELYADVFARTYGIDFIGLRKVGLTVAVAILAIGGVMMTTIGIPRGIDFTGGRNYVVKFDHNVTPAEITSLVSPALDGHVSVIRITSEDQVRISTNYKVETNTPEVDKEI